MWTKLIPSLLAVALLAGCSTPATVHFDSEVAIPPPKDPVPRKAGAAAVDQFDNAEMRQIESAVFTWLLQNPASDDHLYSAVFLRTDEKTTASLMSRFPAHTPPVKQAWHLEIRPGRSPLDMDTLRPAMLLSVEASEPENGLVEAIGKWSAGETAAGTHVFVLKQAEGVWKIQSVK